MKVHRLIKTISRILRDFLILALLGNGLTLFTLPVEFLTLEIFLRNSMLSVLIGYPTWKGIDFIYIILERKFPWLKNPLKRLLVQVVSTVLFTGIIMISGISLWVVFDQDITFATINQMAFKSLLLGFGFLVFSLLAGNAFLFFKNWKNAAIQQEELKRAHLALQYQGLKDQVKPHFLFNSLSSLVTLINTDPAKATEFVHKLSDVYRYLLEQRENELVPVSEELKFLEDYTFLQKIRFGENLRISVRLDTNLNRMVLPQSMQMMVENAIKHNEISKNHPLEIEIYPGDDQTIIIKNSLQKKESLDNSLGMGLENIRKRTAFFTDRSISIVEDSGSFAVSIPTLSI